MFKSFATNKLRIARNKTMATAIALILTLTIATLMASMPTVNAADYPTYAFLAVAPNPIGVGQKVQLTFWLNIPPPTALGPHGARWVNLTVKVTKPDGNTETLGPFQSDAAGNSYTSYVPDTTGTYYFEFSFPGQEVTGVDYYGYPVDNYYEPSTTPKVALTVQQQPISYLPSTPLPTGYWQRPINAENYLWSNISGNWLSVGSSWPFGPTYNASGTFAPYTTAPNSAHIVWTKPLAFGGIVGGEFGSTEYYTGEEYERKFYPPIIINGVLYYNTPDPPQYGFTAVDLRTGQTLWWHNSTGQPPTIIGFPGHFAYPGLSMGQLYNYESPNQMGVIPYLWSMFGSTWSMYDAFTGNWILNIENASYLSLWPNTISEIPIMLSPQGDIIAYALDGTNNWLAMWNSSKAIPTPTDYGTAIYGAGTGEWCWRPPMGATLDWNAGIQWNVTIPHVPEGDYSYIQAISSDVILAATGGYYTTGSYQMEVGYSAKTGQQLWIQNRTLTPGTTTWEFHGPVGDGVYTEFHKETMTWYGYDINTGQKLWGPTEPYTNAWGMYNEGNPATNVIAYGKLYACGYDGMVHCYNVKTGEHLWDFSTGNSGLETPYGTYPTEFQVIADGKDFIATGEHHTFVPMWKGEGLYCINAETGKQLWNISGWMDNPVVADGYLATFNDYDNQIYCFGKGQTATTVTASPKVSVHGDSVLIEGTVTDQSPGQTCLGIPAAGTPAIADESMSAWMEYLYQQQPMPTNATGVEVTLDAVDPNGNFIHIDTVTSDVSGMFKKMFTPEVPGEYTIIVTFAGSKSYYSSYAETAIGVSPAPAATPPPEKLVLPPTEMYVIGTGVAIIIAIAIVGILMLRKQRK